MIHDLQGLPLGLEPSEHDTAVHPRLDRLDSDVAFSSIQVNPLTIQNAKPLDGFNRRQRLVVVDHDRDGIADHVADCADDFQGFAERGIADLRLDALDSFFHPFRCRPCRALGTIVTHRAIGWDRLGDAAQ